MSSAKFSTVCAATNSSLGIVNWYFDNLYLLSNNPCLIPAGCCMTAYAAAYVLRKLASRNTWIPIISKMFWPRLIDLGIFTFVGTFFSHFFLFSQSNLIECRPMKFWNHKYHNRWFFRLWQLVELYQEGCIMMSFSVKLFV